MKFSKYECLFGIIIFSLFAIMGLFISDKTEDIILGVVCFVAIIIGLIATTDFNDKNIL